jgi:hypothetical protein
MVPNWRTPGSLTCLMTTAPQMTLTTFHHSGAGLGPENLQLQGLPGHTIPRFQ